MMWPFSFGETVEHLLAFWTMVLAVLTGVLAASVPLSFYLYAKQEKREAALRDREESIKRDEEIRIARDFKTEERDKFYAQLDQMYLDIQKIIIMHPHLAYDDFHRVDDQLVQYNAFAFIVWNFIETIHDYCLDQDDLRDTWHCILEVESRKYRSWIEAPENRAKFKDKFLRYIDSNILA